MRHPRQRPSLPLPSGSQTRPRRRYAAPTREGSDSRCRTACIGRAPRESSPEVCGRYPPTCLSPWAAPPALFPRTSARRRPVPTTYIRWRSGVRYRHHIPQRNIHFLIGSRQDSQRNAFPGAPDCPRSGASRGRGAPGPPPVPRASTEWAGVQYWRCRTNPASAFPPGRGKRNRSLGALPKAGNGHQVQG